MWPCPKAGGFQKQGIILPTWMHATTLIPAAPRLLPPLQGPGVETLGQLVQSGLGFLLTALKQDPNAHVKDTTAWTIGASLGYGKHI